MKGAENPVVSNNLDFKSAKGALWELRQVDERDVITLTQKYDMPEILARILIARGVKIDGVENFLSPTLKEFMPDPMHLLDMEKAAEQLAEAVVKGEEIAIFGDYDVDGATSSALLKRFFREVGNEPVVYIPDRITEGYGPNPDAMAYLREHGIDICVTVDCGTLAFEALEKAAEVGLKVVVIDHHLGSEKLPIAEAVVNPNRLDETSEHRHLAAVGVSFLLAVAVNSKLKEKGWYNNREAPDLMSLLDIVALGTVCDVVPLKGVNRAFVTQGLKVMRKRNNLGLRALSNTAKVDDIPNSYHLGFALGPRINAGGRVGKSDLGARLLSTEDVDEAYDIAQLLDKYNAERKAIEGMVLDSALAQVEEKDTDSPLLFAVGENWHPGVIGIVASRVTERFHRPSAIISIKDGVGKASARSVNGVDFGSAIVAASQAGLLIAGGGHAMAAGFTVAEDKIDELHKFLSERFSANIDELITKKIKIDGHLSLDAITMDLADLINKVAPFGTSNPEPKFIFPDVHIIRADIVGADHIKCILGSSQSGHVGKTVKAMCFRCLETPLGKMLLQNSGQNLNIAGRIKVNSWNGVDSAEIVIDDAAIEI